METKEYAEAKKNMLDGMAGVYRGYLGTELEGLYNAVEGVKEGDMGFLYVVLDHAAKAIQHQMKIAELEGEMNGIGDIAGRL